MSGLGSDEIGLFSESLNSCGVLTSMSIIDYLCEQGTFTQWGSEGREMQDRKFFYTDDWLTDYNALDGGVVGAKFGKDLSERGRIAGLINQYILGVAKVKLVTPNGYGADPVIKRLEPPREAIAYFRTGASGRPVRPGVRCFGFFRSPNVFFAMAMMRKNGTRHKGFDPIDEKIGKLQILVERLRDEVDISTDVELLITP